MSTEAPADVAFIDYVALLELKCKDEWKCPLPYYEIYVFEESCCSSWQCYFTVMLGGESFRTGKALYYPTPAKQEAAKKALEYFQSITPNGEEHSKALVLCRREYIKRIVTRNKVPLGLETIAALASRQFSECMTTEQVKAILEADPDYHTTTSPYSPSTPLWHYGEFQYGPGHEGDREDEQEAYERYRQLQAETAAAETTPSEAQ
jgi:hypothetical protein